MKLLTALIANLIIVSIALAVDPIAVLTGPGETTPGHMVVVRTDGTVGIDYKIETNPKIENLLLVKFEDGSTGLVFQAPDEAGIYTIVLGVNSNNKTALAIYNLTVSGNRPTPGPNPKPDELSKLLIDAYKTDLAAGVGTKEQKQLLAANYRQAPESIFTKCKTFQELQDTMHKANDTLIGEGKLPGLRKAISGDVITNLGVQGTTLLDQTNLPKAKNEWLRIASYLDKLP